MDRQKKSGSTISGTKFEDIVVLGASDLVDARVYLGAGYDTLAISSDAGLVFDSDSYIRLTGVDALDFSNSLGGPLTVALDSALLQQSDYGVLTIVSGLAGIDSLGADTGGVGTFVVAGSGRVRLADGQANQVTIADNSDVEVFGGSGSDTITAASDGSILNGGRGDDVLVLGASRDIVVIEAQSGHDTIVDFDLTADAIDFIGTSFHSFGEIITASSDGSDGATHIDLGGSNRLVIQGVAAGELAARQFSIDGIGLEAETYVISTDVTAAELNQLIASAADGSTFILADGVHTFTESVVIDRGNITFKGQSESGTIIQFDFRAGNASDGLMVTGGSRTYIGVADSAAVAGDSSIIVAGNNLVAGDTIYMFQNNTREWLDANGWQNVSMEDADHRPLREAILQVDRVDGDIVHFTHAIPYDMDQGEVNLNRIELFGGLAISDFTLTSSLGVSDAHDFSNTLPEYMGTTAFSLVGTIGATLERVSVTDSGSVALSIGSSIDMTADDIFVSGSHNKGGGGNGYGLVLSESNNNTLSNLEIFDTRHGFITSAWSAETDNIVYIANTNRDVGFHGSPDRGNVVQIDNSVLDFDVPFYGNGGSGWTVISGSGSTHPAIDPFAENSITFGNVEGVNRNDTMYADDHGVYMNGKYGYDTLIGGRGDDYLVGGTLSDTLTGGDGSDTFLLRVGDGLDVITDMQFGEAGDTIVFAGNPAVTSFENLYIYIQDGEVRVRYGTNATVILQGVDLSDIDGSNFSFDPTGTLTAERYYGSDFLPVG